MAEQVLNEYWGHIVVIASFLVSLLTDGFLYHVGAFYEIFLHQYQESPSYTSLFVSCCTGLVCLLGPLAASLIEAFGYRTISTTGAVIAVMGMLLSTIFDHNMTCINIFLGIVAGTGLSFVYTAQLFIPSKWFNKNVSFATGLSVAGSGIGVTLFGPIIRTLTLHHDWRVAMRVLTGFMAFCIPLSLTFTVPEQEKKAAKSTCDPFCLPTISIQADQSDVGHVNSNFTQDVEEGDQHQTKDNGLESKQKDTNNNCPKLGENIPKAITSKAKKFEKKFFHALRDSLNYSILSDKVFLLYTLANSLVGLAYYIPMMIINDRMTRHKIGQEGDALLVMTVFGLTNTFSRAFFGWIADFKHVKRMMLYGLAIFFYGVCILLSHFTNNLVGVYVIYALLGIFEGIHAGLVSVSLNDFFTPDFVLKAFGVSLLFDGIAAMVGPTLLTKLNDHDDTYGYLLFASSSLEMLGGVIIVLLAIFHHKFAPSRFRHAKSSARISANIDDQK